jgi:hypothetical protein
VSGADPEFRLVLFRVVAIGGTIMIIGAVVLYFAFRAFAPSEKPRGEFRAVVGVVAVLAIVMAGCLVLLMFSFPKP